MADSPAELAGQMRAVILKKVQNGESEGEIVEYFVSAYGDSVLLEPPRRGLGWLVWLAPLVALASGMLVLMQVLRSWVRPAQEGPTGSPSPSLGGGVGEGADPHATRVRQELDAARGGRSE